MSVALRYLSLEEVSGMTEKLASMCRQLGVSQGDLDRTIDAGLMPMMIQMIKAGFVKPAKQLTATCK